MRFHVVKVQNPRTLDAMGALLTTSAAFHSTGAPQPAWDRRNWRRAVLRLLRRAGQRARCARSAWWGCGQACSARICGAVRWTVGRWVQDDSNIVMRLLGVSTSLVVSTANTVLFGRIDAAQRRRGAGMRCGGGQRVRSDLASFRKQRRFCISCISCSGHCSARSCKYTSVRSCPRVPTTRISRFHHVVSPASTLRGDYAIIHGLPPPNRPHAGSTEPLDTHANGEGAPRGEGWRRAGRSGPCRGDPEEKR